jgi:hypothetical protein
VTTPKRFARAPRKARPADAFHTATLARNLSGDDRFGLLSHAGRVVLLTAALRFTDASGRFWPKVQTLADAAHVSDKACKDALTDACGLEIVRREPYARPDGMQGSTTYYFDAVLLPEAKVGKNVPPCRPMSTTR